MRASSTRSLGRFAAVVGPCAGPAAASLRTAAAGPEWATARVSATGDRASTLVVQGPHTITIDHPLDQGGRDNAPGPVAHFLGSLIGAQQASLHSVSEEERVTLGKVEWKAEAKIDARGVHGEGSTPAEFDSIQLNAHVETDVSTERLKELKALSTQRCIVANTLAKAGVQLDIVFTKKHDFKSRSDAGQARITTLFSPRSPT